MWKVLGLSTLLLLLAIPAGYFVAGHGKRPELVRSLIGHQEVKAGHHQVPESIENLEEHQKVMKGHQKSAGTVDYPTGKMKSRGMKDEAAGDYPVSKMRSREQYRAGKHKYSRRPVRRNDEFYTKFPPPNDDCSAPPAIDCCGDDGWWWGGSCKNDMCEFADWCDYGGWGECSVTCGGGTRCRQRAYCYCHGKNVEVCDPPPPGGDIEHYQWGACNQICYNGGTYDDGDDECVCPAGYTGSCCSDDVNECTEGTDDCDSNAECTNTEGSFSCTCNPGYSGDGVSCEDINECSNATHTCDVNAICTNTPGSFNCTCRPGYSGNGTVCTAMTLPPFFDVIQLEYFSSSTGDAFPPECVQLYGQELNSKAMDMIPVVNDRIGSVGICEGKNIEDIQAVGVSISFIADGTEGESRLFWTLSVSASQRIDAVAVCAAEIGLFLGNHGNWESPILPELPDCPGVLFQNGRFNTTGLDWACADLNDLAEVAILQLFLDETPSPLQYNLMMTGLLNTENGEEVDTECLVQQTERFREKTYEQVVQTNQKMGSEMCSGYAAQLGMRGVNLLGSGTQVSSLQDLVLEGLEEMTFNEVQGCANEVSSYLGSHDNWIQPIISTPAGCPTLVFEPAQFTLDDQKWVC